MRKLRPEQYSDTKGHLGYVLDRAVFEHHLETITQRNQTHDFEIFCRKLCERTICPNLRPQTGPEGGGDGKVDTETYAVGEAVAGLTYVGISNAAGERWGFAYSAKSKWAEKVRHDVEGIVEADRGYARIICVTSRAARSKSRLALEDELSRQYGIPVTIHDRSWIVEEIIDHDRKDLAFNYLGVGEASADPTRLGPADYSRLQQLTDIERELEDPTAFEGMERQRVTEALVAAKLARGLEKPRTDIDGRFLRAIRLADQHGSYRQRVAAHYESLWTGFWWFDDVLQLNAGYPAFERLTMEGDHAYPLELLCNLHQLLINSVVHELASPQECDLDARSARLVAALDKMVANPDRPNNALEAETSLAFVRLSRVTLSRDYSALPDIWRWFQAIIERAQGLGEFDPRRLTEMIDAVGEMAGNESAFNDLVEDIAGFVSRRSSEIAGARILLKRAEKLGFEHNLEMIRLLGRAAVGLNKKEYRESLVEALHLLGMAYRSAGLLWAARSTFVFAAACIAMEGEEDGQLPALFVPTIKTLAWIALELRHIPDFLESIQLLNGCATSLPLDEETQELVRSDLRQLDLGIASVFLNLGAEELASLGVLPDILERMGFMVARMALLYAMGRSDVLRADGSLPATETDAEVDRFLTLLRSQPVSAEPRYRLVVNAGGHTQYSAAIMGMTIGVSFDGTPNGTLVGEAVMGSLEAFFATALEKRVFPHTERFDIRIVMVDGSEEPDFAVDHFDYTGVLSWPASLAPNSFTAQDVVQRSLIEISGMVLGTTCVVEDEEAFLERMFANEAVQQRMGMVPTSLNSYNRVMGRSFTRLDAWDEISPTTYELRHPLPAPTRIAVSEAERQEEDDIAAGTRTMDEPPSVRDHRDIAVRSVIDVHIWNKARWRGNAYQIAGPKAVLGLLFEDEAGARKLFERWRERFGETDAGGEVALTIVRNLPGREPHHYCMVVAGRKPEFGEMRRGQYYSELNRSQLMEPANDRNLQVFISAFEQSREFYLVPAIPTNEAEPPRFLHELGIRKFDIRVMDASDLEPHDVANVALMKRAPRDASEPARATRTG